MDEVHKRLSKAFTLTHLEVIDESDQHVGHVGYQGGGRHLAIIISAKEFNGLSRVEIHRKIYAALSDLMLDKIHALRITCLDIIQTDD